MKGVIANSPSHGTFVGVVTSLVGLALDAEVHDVIAADGTGIDVDVPRPQRNRVPFFDFETFSSSDLI